MTAPTIDVRSISKAYGDRLVLSDVSFAVPAGEPTAVIGPSGTGKSTLLRILSGLEPPSAGEVFLRGTRASAPDRVLVPPHRRGIAMVFQDLALWPNLTVLENVLLGLSGTPLSRSEARRRASEALALCSIAGLRDRLPATISGGEQQRTALARAIAPHPELLLLDEPFSGLDLVTKMKLLEEIAILAEARGIALLLVTHDPMEALRLCSSAIVLERGRVRESGRLEDLLRAPVSQALRVFRDCSGRSGR